MLPSVKAGLLLAAGLSGTAFLCPLCGGGIQTAGAQNAPVTAQAPDTATVRLHISRMTCGDRKSTRLNSSHGYISYAVFCLKKKKHDTAAQRHLQIDADETRKLL